MRKLTARLLFGGSLLAALGAGLSLGFLMDYFLGWQFGASELVLELTDTLSYSVLAFMAIVASVSAISFFRKKNIPDVALSLLHHCITLAAVLVMGVSSYCILPSSVRNTAFGWGVGDFLFVFPGEAGLLRKTLTEKRPDPAEGRIDFLDTPAPLLEAVGKLDQASVRWVMPDVATPLSLKVFCMATTGTLSLFF